MTYRDDNLARAVHLESLERERAQTERTARRLDAVLAELGEDAKEQARRARPRRAPPGRDFGMMLGVLGGLITGCLVGTAGYALLGATSCGSGFHVAMSGSLAESTHSLVHAGDPCTVTLSGDGGRYDDCRARVMCGTTVLYDGLGGCSPQSGDDVIRFTDGRIHDGDAACLVSEARHLAVIHTAEWTVTIASLVREP